MSVCFGSDQSPTKFSAWAKKREIFLHPNVAFLVPTKTMGFGVFARNSLPAGTVIVSCPINSCISPYNEFPCNDSPCMKALVESNINDNILYVVLRLMAEAIRNNSPWMPWLKACPRMPHHFFDLNAEKIENVFGFTTSENCKESSLNNNNNNNNNNNISSLSWTGFSQQLREVKVLNRWNAAQKIILKYPEYWPEQKCTFSLFCDCLAQVLSRNFHREEIEGREGPYLLPGLDIINHSSISNAKFEIRGGGRKHVMHFCVISSRELRRGEQVLCSYGKIGASRFAIEFQFVSNSVMEEDILRFSLEVISEITQTLLSDKELFSGKIAINLEIINHRLEWLQRLGFLFDEGFYISRLPLDTDNSSSFNINNNSNGNFKELSTSIIKEINTLFNVFYLMTVDNIKFDNLIHSINREWEVEKTEEVISLVMKVLTMRADSVHLQLKAAEVNFTETSDDERKKLLKMALNSELEMIHRVQKYINEKK